jgi:deazaflavin-dependent oxidoreductase (nitroreductase family)
MPLPRWLARFNKRFINPREIRRGNWPILIHMGRSSGKIYQTPLDAHPIHGGFVFIPMYGPRTDWLRNVLAAGTARLSIRGETMQLRSPRMVKKRDIWPLLLAGARAPMGVSDKTELLCMDLCQNTQA